MFSSLTQIYFFSPWMIVKGIFRHPYLSYWIVNLSWWIRLIKMALEEKSPCVLLKLNFCQFFFIETLLSVVHSHMLFSYFSCSWRCIYPNPWWLAFKLLFKFIPKQWRQGLEKYHQNWKQARFKLLVFSGAKPLEHFNCLQTSKNHIFGKFNKSVFE